MHKNSEDDLISATLDDLTKVIVMLEEVNN